MVMSGQSVKLAILFIGRLRPPKRLNSTKCTYFPQQLTTAFLNPSPAVCDNCRFYGVGHFESLSGMLDTRYTPKVEVVL